jgi:hypothetical protein
MASFRKGHLVVAAGVLLALLVVRAAAGLFAETPKGCEVVLLPRVLADEFQQTLWNQPIG